jgi:hypothetical protein
VIIREKRLELCGLMGLEMTMRSEGEKGEHTYFIKTSMYNIFTYR